MFFFRSPLFSLNTVDPETKIFAPAFFAKEQFSKFIPPSISISTLRFFFSIKSFNNLVYSNTSGINFCPPKPGSTLIISTKSILSR